MKILWVNPSFLDYRVPVYKRLYELSDGKFYILFSQNRVPDRVIRKIKDAIGEHAIIFNNERILKIGNDKGMANKYITIPFTKGLYKTIKSIKADLIISEGFFQWTHISLLYTLLHHKKLVIAYERTKHTERNCPFWRTAYRKLVNKFTSGYLCNGKLTVEYLNSIGVKKNKCFIGGMSADSSNLSFLSKSVSLTEKIQLKQKLNINQTDGLVYMSIGQLVERKGYDYLFRAWKIHINKYPNDKLIIIGTGDYYDRFKKNYDSNNLMILGAIDYDLIYKYYSISDIFIIPTLEDNWSLVVPEAMACGLPIACSIYNGCYPELVHENINGKLFDPLKKDTIIETLEYFHHVDLKVFGENSIEIEKEYNYEKVSDKIYKACLKIYNAHK